MLNEKNIETLKSQLQSLGFAGGMEYELRSNICFQPNHFNVLYRQSKEGDTMNVILHFERHENIEYYSCRYYDACLRKKIEIPTIKLNEIDTKDLEEKMTLVNWNFSYVSNHANKAGRENHLSWEERKPLSASLLI